MRTQKQVAAFFRVTHRTVDAWRKEGMPGQRASYNLAEIYNWRRSRETTELESDALEWQRRERAKILTLERREREGILVRIHVVLKIFLRLACMLRDTGDRLQREHGPVAAEMLNETVDAWLNQLERVEGDSQNYSDA